MNVRKNILLCTEPIIQLVSLCCLFVSSKRPYSEDTNFYFALGDWFGFSRDKIQIEKFPSWPAPDICCACFSSYGKTIGGRLRVSCPNCFPKFKQENEGTMAYPDDAFFLSWCLPNLAQGLGINEELLEAHIAEAIIHAKIQYNESIPNQASK